MGVGCVFIETLFQLRAEEVERVMERELVYFPKWLAGRRGYVEKIRAVYHDYIHRNGLRPTRQREEILDYLLQAKRHLSQDDIYRALKRKGIGKVTVFRTLKLLEECGLLNTVYTSEETPKYEIEQERPHHDHLICVECGSIQEVRWPEIEKIQEKMCKKHNFIPDWHRHEVFGRCADCAAERP